MNQKQIRAAVEAMLFASGDPIGADKLAQAVQLPQLSVEAALEALRERYAREDSGLCLLQEVLRRQLALAEELKLPDVTVLAEIYAAREQNDIGISSQDLAREIPGAIYCSSLEKVTDTLASLAQPGDLILTVGAGDIFRAGEKLLERA